MKQGMKWLLKNVAGMVFIVFVFQAISNLSHAFAFQAGDKTELLGQAPDALFVAIGARVHQHQVLVHWSSKTKQKDKKDTR
jgi:catechol-2,3-dioxygenase